MAICKQTKRCHVNGRGLSQWGKTFPAELVKTCSSSAVSLVGKDPDSGSIRHIASGTLVWNNVVLCASHSLNTVNATEVEIQLFFECDASTSPPGHASDKRKNSSAWTSCTITAANPQAKVVEVLENHSRLDFAFLRIEWYKVKKTNGQETVSLPEVPDIPNLGRLSKGKGDEVLLVGHPWGANSVSEPKQASAGIVSVAGAPHPKESTGNTFSYASFAAGTGMSGGGVFNKSGEIIGLLQGVRYKAHEKTGASGNAFLNLATVANTTKTNQQGKSAYESPRIRQWYGGGPPLFKHETKSSVIFRK